MLRICTSGQQVVNSNPVPLADARMERGVLIAGPKRIWLGPQFQEQRHEVIMPSLGGHVERQCAGAARRGEAGPSGELGHHLFRLKGWRAQHRRGMSKTHSRSIVGGLLIASR